MNTTTLHEDDNDEGDDDQEIDYDLLIKKVVNAARDDFKDRDSSWRQKRDTITLDLLQKWMFAPFTFETYVDDMGYDSSQRSRRTSTPPDFWGLNTLSEWLDTSTGRDIPTYIGNGGDGRNVGG